MFHEKDIGFIHYPGLRSQLVIEKMKVLAGGRDTLNCVSIDQLEAGSLDRIPGTVVAIGGDGTVNRLVSWLYLHQNYPNLLVAGGGTGDTFRRMLIDKGAVVEARNLNQPEIQEGVLFRPGKIVFFCEEKQFPAYFISAAGWGDFEIMGAKKFESVYHTIFPSGMKMLLRGILAYITVCAGNNQQEAILQTVTVGPNAGPYRVFPPETGMSLDNPNLGLVEISGQSVYERSVKLILAASFWQLGLIPPQSVVRTAQSEAYTHPVVRQNGLLQVNIDGDLREFHIHQGLLKIKRCEDGIPAAAIVFQR